MGGRCTGTLASITAAWAVAGTADAGPWRGNAPACAADVAAFATRPGVVL